MPHCDTWKLLVSHEGTKGNFLKCSNKQVQTQQLTILILGLGYGTFLDRTDNSDNSSFIEG